MSKILRDVIDIQRFTTYLGGHLSNSEHGNVCMSMISAPDAAMFLRHVSALGLSPEKMTSVEDALCLASMAKRG